MQKLTLHHLRLTEVTPSLDAKLLFIFQSTELTPLRELFDLLQIKPELFDPNQPQTSSDSEPLRIVTPQPSDSQESSSYESQ